MTNDQYFCYSFCLAEKHPPVLHVKFWLTSFFMASRMRFFSSLRLWFILALRLFSIKGLEDCRKRKKSIWLNSLFTGKDNTNCHGFKCPTSRRELCSQGRLFQFFLKFRKLSNFYLSPVIIRWIPCRTFETHFHNKTRVFNFPRVK